MGVETFSAGVLLVLGIVAFNNLRAGTLDEWIRAKFLNRAEPNLRPKSATKATLASSSTPAAAPGAFTAPLPSLVCSSPFGEKRGSGTHPGLDLSAASGTPIGAIAPGRVTFAGGAGDCGLRVVVDHGGGLESRYCHLSRIGTHVGAQVGSGEKIGEVGSTGNSTGPHLHLEVARNGTLTDPAPLIGVSCGTVIA